MTTGEGMDPVFVDKVDNYRLDPKIVVNVGCRACRGVRIGFAITPAHVVGADCVLAGVGYLTETQGVRKTRAYGGATAQRDGRSNVRNGQCEGVGVKNPFIIRRFGSDRNHIVAIDVGMDGG